MKLKRHDFHGSAPSSRQLEVACGACRLIPRPSAGWLTGATYIASVVAFIALLGVSGCASPGPSGARATLLSSSSVLPADAAAASDQTHVAVEWWTSFRDPALDALERRALADSPSLRRAEARVQSAVAATQGTEAATGPRLDAAADATRERFTKNGLYPPPLGGSVVNSADLQLNGSWELDFFGRNAAALAAALGNQRAAQADAAAARLMLSSQVAHQYFQLARLFAERAVAQRSLDQRQAILVLIHDRVDAGLDTTVELRQGEGSVPEIRSQIEALDEQIALTQHALAALTGQPATVLGDLAPRLQAVVAWTPPAAVPADLLGQRADVAAARWRVEAATQDAAVARTQFYPNVNLTAFVGLNSFGLNKLFEAGSGQVGFGPAVSLPVFDAGRLRANLHGKNADLDAAVDSYNATVIDAVRDAADQIASVQSIARQQQQQAEATLAAERAYDLAVQRYRAGLGTYLVVLNVETNVLTQRRAAVDLKARALDAQVALARALGGGYVPAAGESAPMARVASGAAASTHASATSTYLSDASTAR
jgi:NodT family efflux transporter outer membrane factor (OMF) lipoprotein